MSVEARTVSWAWGVILRAPDGDTGPLWSGWDVDRIPRDDEPPRSLVFRTGRAASAWGRAKRASYRHYPDGHACRSWRFVPVRMRITEEVL